MISSLTNLTAVVICCIFLGTSSIAQEVDETNGNKKTTEASVQKTNITGSEYNIDPRNFVRIYQKRYKEHSLDTIYQLDQIENFRFIDKQSKIIIKIDRDSLAKTTEFTGSISLEAYLDDRKISISGYSTVGVEQNIIGNDGMSSTFDFASSFFGLIYETGKISKKLESVKKMFESISGGYEIENLYKDLLKEDISELKRASTKLKNSLDNFEREFNNDTILEDIVRKIDYLFFENYFKDGELYGYPWPLGIDYALGPRDQLIALKDLVEIEYANLEKELENENAQTTDLSKLYQREVEALNSVFFEIPLMVNYFEYLNNSNTETSQAFSKSINRDPIFVRFITSGLIKATDDFNTDYQTFKAEYEADDPDPQKLREAFSSLRRPINNLYYITNQLVSVRDEIILDASKYFGDEFYKMPVNLDASELEKFEALYEDPTLSKNYVKKLATQSGRQIYKKLIDGVIDLEAENPKSGSILRIYVVWYNRQGKNKFHLKDTGQSNIDQESLEVPKELLLHAKYEVKEIGWRLKVSDSFLLVNRINPPDSGDVSPSRFKGAAGVSLLWTYGDGKTASTGFGRFLGSTQPSFGISVAYVDFSTEKDIEIALGAIMGLFSNRVFLTFGANLNVEESPWYFGIGLSFANIAGKLGKNE